MYQPCKAAADPLEEDIVVVDLSRSSVQVPHWPRPFSSRADLCHSGAPVDDPLCWIRPPRIRSKMTADLGGLNVGAGVAPP